MEHQKPKGLYKTNVLFNSSQQADIYLNTHKQSSLIFCCQPII